MIYGYMRVSTKEQNEQRQLHALLAFGIHRKHIYMDKLSGKDFNRTAYQRLVYRKLAPGDLIVVKSIDRLGRNYNEIIHEWKTITKDLGADIKVLDMPLLDTRKQSDLVGTLISDIVLQLLSFVAESERNNIRERQAEGIAIAKLQGIHLGRPALPIPDNFGTVYKQWKSKEIYAYEAYKQAQLTKSQFYRAVKRHEGNT